MRQAKHTHIMENTMQAIALMVLFGTLAVLGAFIITDPVTAFHVLWEPVAFIAAIWVTICLFGMGLERIFGTRRE